jgi:SulP family sulfate permease
VLSSLSVGLVLYLLGVRRRGNLVRYVPFPVIGGFFLYIAWLLLQGGLSSMIGQRLSPANASLLLDPALWLHWLPGLLAAAALFALQLTRRHYLNVPLFLVGAVALFWLVAWAAGIPLAALQAGGYVLSTHADHATWSPAWLLEALAHADWRVALHEAPQLVVLWLICMVTLLLSASSAEVATRSDVDLNQELKVPGIANMLYGLGGGPPATSRRAPAFCRTTWAPGPGWSG